jgi:hypothetical protein
MNQLRRGLTKIPKITKNIKRKVRYSSIKEQPKVRKIAVLPTIGITMRFNAVVLNCTI